MCFVLEHQILCKCGTKGKLKYWSAVKCFFSFSCNYRSWTGADSSGARQSVQKSVTSLRYRQRRSHTFYFGWKPFECGVWRNGSLWRIGQVCSQRTDFEDGHVLRSDDRSKLYLVRLYTWGHKERYEIMILLMHISN